jgi:predicted enzyme related to lactoylglutathione lyase
MPHITKPVPGNFCWIELNTTDPAAAGKFYGEILGWSFTEMKMADGHPYLIAKVGDANAAGIRLLGENATKMGTASQWMSFIASADVDATVAKATKAGGNVLVAAAEAGGMGRMAVVADPSGAVLSLWQEKQSMGAFVYGEKGALCWNELTTTNVDAAGKFYATVLGWKPETAAMPGAPGGQYTTFKNGETMTGGMMAMPADMKGAPSTWTAYFSVPDVDAQVAKAGRMGAKVIVPARDIPTVGRFAWLRDPQGAVFAIIKVMPPAAK